MEYKITDYRNKKPIIVRSHERMVRPYSKGRKWYERLGRWIWSWLKTPFTYTLATFVFGILMVNSFFAGALWRVYNPMPVAEAETIQQVIVGTTTPEDSLEDQIDRIGFAETRLNQFCDSDAIAHKLCPSYEEGAVLQTTNKNGTIDTGKFAVNSIWLGKATELGYDVYTEQGNHDFAIWLAQNEGVNQWYSSAKVWK